MCDWLFEECSHFALHVAQKHMPLVSHFLNSSLSLKRALESRSTVNSGSISLLQISLLSPEVSSTRLIYVKRGLETLNLHRSLFLYKGSEGRFLRTLSLLSDQATCNLVMPVISINSDFASPKEIYD